MITGNMQTRSSRSPPDIVSSVSGAEVRPRTRDYDTDSFAPAIIFSIASRCCG